MANIDTKSRADREPAPKLIDDCDPRQFPRYAETQEALRVAVAALRAIEAKIDSGKAAVGALKGVQALKLQLALEHLDDEADKAALVVNEAREAFDAERGLAAVELASRLRGRHTAAVRSIHSALVALDAANREEEQCRLRLVKHGLSTSSLPNLNFGLVVGRISVFGTPAGTWARTARKRGLL